MKSRILISCLVMLAAALPAGARPPHAVTEDGHELIASMITLPTNTASSFTVQQCTACRSMNFTLSATTQYVVGKTQVTLATMRSALAEHPRAAVLIVTPIGKSEVTRISTSLVDQQ